MPEWERDDLVFNLVEALKQCDQRIQEQMVAHFTKCDEAFGRTVADGIGIDNSKLDVDELVAAATIGGR
jgi:catalase